MPTLEEILNDLDKAEKKQTIYDEQPSSVSDVMFYLTHQEDLQKNTQAALESNQNPTSLDSVIATEERNQQVNQALTGSRVQNLEERGNGFFQAKPDHIPWSDNAYINVAESLMRAPANFARGAQKNVGDFLEGVEDVYNSTLEWMGLFNDGSDDKIDVLHNLSRYIQERVPDVPLSDSSWDQFFFSLGAPENTPETESVYQNFSNQLGYQFGHGIKDSMPVIFGSGLAGRFATMAKVSPVMNRMARIFGAGAGGAVSAAFSDRKTVAEGAKQGVTMELINSILAPYSRTAQVVAGTMFGATTAAFQNDVNSPEYAENVAIDAIMNTVFALFGPAGKRSMLKDVNKVATNTKAWVLKQKRDGKPFDVTTYLDEFHSTTMNSYKDMVDNRPNRKSAINDLQTKLKDLTGKDSNLTGKDLVNEIQRTLLSSEDAANFKPSEAKANAEAIVKMAEVIDNPNSFANDTYIGSLLKESPEIIPYSRTQEPLREIEVSPGVKLMLSESEASSFFKKKSIDDLNSQRERLTASKFDKSIKSKALSAWDKFLKLTVFPDGRFLEKLSKEIEGGRNNKDLQRLDIEQGHSMDAVSMINHRVDTIKRSVGFDGIDLKTRELLDERISLLQARSIVSTDLSKNKSLRDKVSGVVDPRKLKSKKLLLSEPEINNLLSINERKVYSSLGETGASDFFTKVDAYFDGPFKLIDELFESGAIKESTYKKIRGRKQPPVVTIEQLEDQLNLFDDPDYVAKFTKERDIDYLRNKDLTFRVTDSEFLLERWVSKLTYLTLRNKPLLTARRIALENPDNPFIKIPKRKFTDDSGREIKIEGNELVVDKKIVSANQTKIVEDGYELIPFLNKGNTDYIMTPKEFAGFWRYNKPISKFGIDVMKWMGNITGVRPLKQLVVGANPVFAVKNLYKETSYFWKSGPFEGQNYLSYLGSATKSFGRILSDIKNKKGSYMRYHDNGGTSATLSRLNSDWLRRERVNRYSKDYSEPGRVRKFIDDILWFNGALEETVRIHAMESLEKTKKPDGSYYTTEEAVHLVNNQLNFNKKGPLLDFINEVIPFANASSQVIVGLGKSFKENPKRFMSKAIQYYGARVMLGTVAYTLAKETMDKVSVRDKINNLIVPLGIDIVNNRGEKEFLYGKLPVEKDPITVLLDSIYFASMDILSGKNKDAVVKTYWDNFKSEITNQMNVDVFGLPPSFEAYQALFSDIDPFDKDNIWYGNPLVEMGKRFDPVKTSSMARFIGDYTGVSPVGLERSTYSLGLQSNVFTSFAGNILTGVSDEEKNNASKALLNFMPGMSSFFKFTNNYDEFLEERLKLDATENKTRVQDNIDYIENKIKNRGLDIRDAFKEVDSLSSLNEQEKSTAKKRLSQIFKAEKLYDRIVEVSGEDVIFKLPTKSTFQKVSRSSSPSFKAKWYLENLPVEDEKIKRDFKRLANAYGFKVQNFFYELKKQREMFNKNK